MCIAAIVRVDSSVSIAALVIVKLIGKKRKLVIIFDSGMSIESFSDIEAFVS
jgi:hypothetical protein